VEGNGGGPVQGTIPLLAWTDWGRSRKNPTKIRTEYLPNIRIASATANLRTISYLGWILHQDRYTEALRSGSHCTMSSPLCYAIKSITPRQQIAGCYTKGRVYVLRSMQCVL
jgi:hypothetical protein